MNLSVWKANFCDASFPELVVTHFGAFLNTYSCEIERDSSKKSTEHILDTGIDMSICANAYVSDMSFPKSGVTPLWDNLK